MIPVVYVLLFIEHVEDFFVELIDFRVVWGEYHCAG